MTEEHHGSDLTVFDSCADGNLFQQLYSLADAMIIGRLVGVYPLAGVGQRLP